MSDQSFVNIEGKDVPEEEANEIVQEILRQYFLPEEKEAAQEYLMGRTRELELNRGIGSDSIVNLTVYDQWDGYDRWGRRFEVTANYESGGSFCEYHGSFRNALFALYRAGREGEVAIDFVTIYANVGCFNAD